VELFETALRIAPSDGNVLLGYAAAMLAAGRGEEAEAAVDLAVERSPFWLHGHTQLAQLRATLGKRRLATASTERALARHPGAEPLWATLFEILLKAEDFPALEDALARARSASIAEPALLPFAAIAASEQRLVDRADQLFAAVGKGRPRIEIWRIRHLLRTGRIAEAVAAIDGELSTEASAAAWPYASIAWRMADDPRWQWLEGDLDRLMSVVDLRSEIPDSRALEQTLRTLHRARGEFLDQSVRGGTQTDGPLFARIDPQLRHLRRAITRPVEQYVKNLPPADPRHPLLRHRRNRRIRFSGSWSVLLRSGGHHSNHVHPDGWISSAFYVALPADLAEPHGEACRDGWLTLGQPQKELGLDLPALRHIRPRVGTLVLFPSWIWHGTIPFHQGERITVAFDVRHPV
jgi:uncharacterized protein (TIGR02466 family)